MAWVYHSCRIRATPRTIKSSWTLVCRPQLRRAHRFSKASARCDCAHSGLPESERTCDLLAHVHSVSTALCCAAFRCAWRRPLVSVTLRRQLHFVPQTHSANTELQCDRTWGKFHHHDAACTAPNYHARSSLRSDTLSPCWPRFVLIMYWAPVRQCVDLPEASEHYQSQQLGIRQECIARLDLAAHLLVLYSGVHSRQHVGGQPCVQLRIGGGSGVSHDFGKPRTR